MSIYTNLYDFPDFSIREQIALRESLPGSL